MMQLKNKHLPVHEKISEVMRKRIQSGLYKQGELLPPELQLAADFNVSRHTMREGLRSLVEEGLIERSRGLGTVVSHRSSRPGRWGVKSINDLMQEFDDSKIILLKRAAIPGSEQPDIARLFKINARGKLFFIHRIMCLNDGPAAVHKLYTTEKYAAKLPQEKIGYKPLIGQIEDHCGVYAFRTRQVASAKIADQEASELLGVAVGQPLLHLRRSYLTRSDELLVQTELLCRPDRYVQVVDFYRELGNGDKPF